MELVKSLNIKDPQARYLASAIAQETGESMTRVVIEALRERFERLQTRNEKASVEELLAIGKRVSAHVKGPNLDHAARSSMAKPASQSDL